MLDFSKTICIFDVLKFITNQKTLEIMSNELEPYDEKRAFATYCTFAAFFVALIILGLCLTIKI